MYKIQIVCFLTLLAQISPNSKHSGRDKIVKWLVAWSTGGTSVSGPANLPSPTLNIQRWVTTYAGKPSACGGEATTKNILTVDITDIFISILHVLVTHNRKQDNDDTLTSSTTCEIQVSK